MMWLSLILLMIVIVILLTYIVLIKKDIRYISSQIEKSHGNYTTIKMETLDKNLDKLTLQINDLYDSCNKKNIEIVNEEKELRKRIASISHDLRTPLTSIIGYLQLLKEKETTRFEKDKYFDIITKRTKILQDLIGSFYDLSRIESEENKFNLKKVNLKDILSENLAVFYNEFKDKKIEPNICIEEDIPYVISDERSVSRIFSNLLNNIVKHGGQDVTINLRKENNSIISEFINDAKDLNDEDIKLIFNSFYTKNPNRNDENTGLGLYIVKTLTEKLGNKIEAKIDDGMLNIKIIWTA
ncbi:MAG: sensor histidine kinase [Clostridiaceae bacterium]